MQDHLLIRRIVLGDRGAGDLLVRTHYPRLYRWLHHLTGSREVAEDLTQQTFLRAWQALGAFEGRSRLVTWLHRIAYFEYTHWLRDQHHDAPLEAAGHLAAPPNNTEWQNLVLPRALAQLPAEQREAFLLYHVQELSIAEVAEILETPPGTVKSRLFTARQRLRELLSEPRYDLTQAEYQSQQELEAVLLQEGGIGR